MKKTHVSMLAALLLSSGSAFAHHGTAGSYDENKVVTVKGVVKEFRWRNPHSALFVVGKDAAGNDVTYALEMGSPATLVKFGYTKTSLKPGDEIVVGMHPSFANPTNGYTPSSLHMVINGKEQKRSAPGESP